MKKKARKEERGDLILIREKSTPILLERKTVNKVMPAVMQKILSIFPMTQGIQLMKAAFLGLTVENAAVPVIVMAAVTLLCAGIGLKFFKWESYDEKSNPPAGPEGFRRSKKSVLS